MLIDAAGTLCVPSESTAAVYKRFGVPFGVTMSEHDILQRFRQAYNTPWTETNIRYVGDGRPFWQHIVAQSTDCTSRDLFEEIYTYYSRPEAWHVMPGAKEALTKLRNHGVKLAVVSNFDTRLRPLLDGLELSSLFDEMVVSAEVGAEKPSPLIFESALLRLGLQPNEVIHVGDDRRNDVWGARDAGISAWLWGTDVTSFDQVASKILTGDLTI
ncbi:hypothetical protein CEUSTIGMA_g1215.t1 [Chlamydomonas eustigma]|uniref:Haloacid dehalogenase-like hydrolase domain-containing protein 3 n=1 Tax=Chlamydomonas eustigma TaxID=1157962 RepID=A0A250WSG6_9CHLO|nr:hypothetical protein CEUSTIGMA_g1215.t1 [Chlamydomonas eustigma]|eukprot:GAX73764.1 hypothetical protein CEUSTIGMA_g1215.t1 [Chlamydomonas eustigma]